MQDWTYIKAHGFDRETKERVYLVDTHTKDEVLGRRYLEIRLTADYLGPVTRRCATIFSENGVDWTPGPKVHNADVETYMRDRLLRLALASPY